MTILLATGAQMHCFIYERLATALGLPPSARATLGRDCCGRGAAGGRRCCCTSTWATLSQPFRESMYVSPMDLDARDDLILSWDWISSHERRADAAVRTTR